MAFVSAEKFSEIYITLHVLSSLLISPIDCVFAAEVGLCLNISFILSMACFNVGFRSKNFEKGANYNQTWGKQDDGKVNSNGPRVVVGEGNMGPQGGFITK